MTIKKYHHLPHLPIDTPPSHWKKNGNFLQLASIYFAPPALFVNQAVSYFLCK
jgi:hypothetical protein